MSPLPDTAGIIRCGACKSRHATKEDVLSCYVGKGLIKDMWPCGWQYEGDIATGDPDEPYYRGIVSCDAPARERADGSGYDCLAGHEHTYAQWMAEHGMAYAEDDLEAAYLAKAGVEPRELATCAPWTRPLPAV